MCSERRGGRSVVIVVALLLGGVGTVAAKKPDPKEAARAIVQKADRLYKLASYQEALEQYSSAYELYPAPGLLFNIGQCHRNLGNYERAVYFFEAYLKEEPKGAGASMAKQLLKESRASLAEQKAEA